MSCTRLSLLVMVYVDLRLPRMSCMVSSVVNLTSSLLKTFSYYICGSKPIYMYCTFRTLHMYIGCLTYSKFFLANRATLKATVILLPLLGLTWLFGILAIDRNTSAMAWLFTICNSTQVWVASNSHIRLQNV